MEAVSDQVVQFSKPLKMASGSGSVDVKDAAKEVEMIRDNTSTKCELEGSFLGAEREASTSVEEPILKRTIIRLKRRIEDSPSKILVLSCKRVKLGVDDLVGEEGDVTAVGAASKEETDGDSGNAVYSQVLRLVGTVPGQEADNNNIATTVRNVLATSSPTVANSFRRNIKARSRKPADKAREEFKQKADANRFKIISSKRGVEDLDCAAITDSTDIDKGGNDLLKLLDLVPESSLVKRRDRAPPEGFEPGNITCNGLPMVKGLSTDHPDANKVGYVYDLYFSNDPCIEDYVGGQFVSVEEGEDELDFGEYREPEVDIDNYVDDDDDSNAEDNWRNDYPEDVEEPFRFDEDHGYDGGVERIGHLDIKDDSSDDDNPIYGIDDDGGNHSYTFDERYQKFKSRFHSDYADEVVSSASESDVDFGE